MMNFLETIFILLLRKNFDMAKNIRRFLENLFEYYYLNIVVNVNFFNDLKFEYYYEHYPKILLQESLKKETKIDGRDPERFSKKITGACNI